MDLRGGVLLPGFVDTHVHYPQVRAIGGLGMPLLDWLDRCALPEEVRLADQAYAEAVAEELLTCLVGAGTTTALVFGSHFAAAVDALFAAADAVRAADHRRPGAERPGAAPRPADHPGSGRWPRGAR